MKSAMIHFELIGPTAVGRISTERLYDFCHSSFVEELDWFGLYVIAAS
jgi:hypothetical protein